MLTPGLCIRVRFGPDAGQTRLLWGVSWTLHLHTHKPLVSSSQQSETWEWWAGLFQPARPVTSQMPHWAWDSLTEVLTERLTQTLSVPPTLLYTPHMPLMTYSSNERIHLHANPSADPPGLPLPFTQSLGTRLLPEFRKGFGYNRDSTPSIPWKMKMLVRCICSLSNIFLAHLCLSMELNQFTIQYSWTF